MLDLVNDEYIVFDLETTGLNANMGDSIIEIGAVKIKEGKIVDRFNELIYPNRELPDEIIEITGITNEMLKGKREENEVVLDFMKWVGDAPLVAHNARFDLSFILSSYKKYNLGVFSNTVIDTLGISRYLDSNLKYHSLAVLVKRYEIPWDENKHHRADYDAEGTALIFIKMLNKLKLNDFNSIKDLKKYPSIIIR